MIDWYGIIIYLFYIRTALFNNVLSRSFISGFLFLGRLGRLAAVLNLGRSLPNLVIE